MNMSYCRFQNTLSALRDCEQAMADGDDLSEEEKKAKDRLIKICVRIAEDYGPDQSEAS